MTLDDAYLRLFDADYNRAHAGSNAERAFLLAADTEDPMALLIALGRDAVAGL
ncbi:hypothetical protein [Lichenihabitans psoromatis]|uniref:hypothetical protein n=1 Tax=Lichenihabitans psoromatis TaxID=2528642 RepID=UPI0013F17211|nr:hypothetical protein [Lichenihabitans psoromatis]